MDQSSLGIEEGSREMQDQVKLGFSKGRRESDLELTALKV